LGVPLLYFCNGRAVLLALAELLIGLVAFLSSCKFAYG